MHLPNVDRYAPSLAAAAAEKQAAAGDHAGSSRPLTIAVEHKPVAQPSVTEAASLKEAMAAQAAPKKEHIPPPEPLSRMLLEVLHSVWRASTGVIDVAQPNLQPASPSRKSTEQPLVYSVKKTQNDVRT